jgi:hypothetical protein
MHVEKSFPDLALWNCIKGSRHTSLVGMRHLEGDFLIGLCNAWTHVFGYCARVKWLVGFWSDRANNIGSSFLLTALVLVYRDGSEDQEHNAVNIKC